MLYPAFFSARRSSTRAVTAAWAGALLVTLGLLGCKAGVVMPDTPLQAKREPPPVVASPAPPSMKLDAEPKAPESGIATVTPNAADTADDECGEGCESGEVDDGAESATPGTIVARPSRHPLDGWSDQQVEDEFSNHPERLGSMSIGYTNAGALYNAVQMPRGDKWSVVDPDHAWGTRETVDFLVHCLNEVEQRFPGAEPMYIGHISGKRGGHLAPHVSHQAGRDVDVSYYYLPGQARWYSRATDTNLDLPRTWAFVKTLVIDTDVELILMDRSVQKLVRDYAVTHGEDKRWVNELFDGGSLPPLIRHAKGHATHIHVRFYNPVAQETGRRAYALLMRHRVIQPAVYFVRYKAKQGDTLSQIARKYGVTEKAIQEANGMKNSNVRATREYKIPRRGGVVAPRITAVPPRRVPPIAAPAARTPADRRES
jgi:murein endopeptidase